jgi:hypothetical protein
MRIHEEFPGKYHTFRSCSKEATTRTTRVGSKTVRMQTCDKNRLVAVQSVHY